MLHLRKKSYYFKDFYVLVLKLLTNFDVNLMSFLSLPKTIDFFLCPFERSSRDRKSSDQRHPVSFFEADVRSFEIRMTAWGKRNQNWDTLSYDFPQTVLGRVKNYA